MSENRFALLIGCSVYDDRKLTPLPSATKDIEELGRVLGTSGIGDFQVSALPDRLAHEVVLAIQDFLAERQSDDLVLVQLSCHGLKDADGKLYFAARNTKTDRLLATAIPATTVNDLLTGCRCRRKLLLLDCCYGGAFLRGIVPRASRRVGVFDRFPEGRGLVVITSSDALQYAYEGELVKGKATSSAFTSLVVKGIETGLADKNGDGLIGVTELYQYVSERMASERPEQRPEINNFRLQGEIYVARSRNISLQLPLTWTGAQGGGEKMVVISGKPETVTLPVGVKDGQQERYVGKGLPAEGGIPPGDLIITFNVAPRRPADAARARLKTVLNGGAALVAICMLLVLGTRYGVYRLSLESTSMGTYDLVVKHGLPFMAPLLGSNQSHLEVSDKLYEVSPKGQEPFAGGSFVFFPAFNKLHLFRWLNDYYLAELKQSPNKKAEISNFFLEQLRTDDQASEAELVKAVAVGAPAAYEVVLAHRLTAEGFQAALLEALEDPDPKTKALTLNALHELYGDDSKNRALTEKVLGSCDANTVKIAMAFSYDPDLVFLTQCATKLLAEKHWKEAASLVVRFQLPHSIVLPWLTTALNSSTSEEFQAAADIVMGLNINDLATIASLRKRLSDSNEKVKTGAALALWNIGADGDLVRQRVREMIVRGNKQPPLSNYVALFRSSLSDDEVTRELEKQLTGVGAGDFTGGWLVAGPDALDVISNLKTKSTTDVCLSNERKARPEDYAQAILTARSVMLGCRDQLALNSLDSYVRTGVRGLLGSMIDPNVSEAYGSMLVEDQHESFDSGLERLWNLLKSQRAESSANYRLAVQYAVARLVVRATSNAQIQQRHLDVMKKVQPWANDEAPHHRAAFVNVSRLIHEAIDRKRLMPLRTQF